MNHILLVSSSIGIIGITLGVIGFVILLDLDKTPTSLSVIKWEREFIKNNPEKKAEVGNDRIPYVLPKTIDTMSNDGSVSKYFYDYYFTSREIAIKLIITGFMLQSAPMIGVLIQFRNSK